MYVVWWSMHTTSNFVVSCMMCLYTRQNNMNFTIIPFVLCNVWFALGKNMEQGFETFYTLINSLELLFG